MTVAVLTLKTAVKLVVLVAIVLSSVPVCIPGLHDDAPEPTVTVAQTFHVEPYGGSAASAAKRQLPSPTEIIDRFIEAAGGEDALRKHESRHSSGEIEVVGQGLGGTIDIYAAAPDKLLVRTDLTGLGVTLNGYDGEVGWSDNPLTGPIILEGRQLDQTRQQADFYGILNADQYVAARETVEETDFDGRRCYKIRIATHWDEEYFEYYDVETGLPAGTERTVSSLQGDVLVTAYVSDFIEVDGVVTPTRLFQDVGVAQIEMIFTQIEYDSVDPAVFALPEAIKALVQGALVAGAIR